MRAWSILIRIRRNYMQNQNIARWASLPVRIVTINFSVSWLKAKERKLAVPEYGRGFLARRCPRPGCGPLSAPAASCSGLLFRFSRRRVPRGSAPRELQQKKLQIFHRQKMQLLDKNIKIRYWYLTFRPQLFRLVKEIFEMGTKVIQGEYFIDAVRVSNPLWFNTDPNPVFFLIADPALFCELNF